MSNFTRQEVLLQAENISLRFDKLILRDINFQIHNIVREGHNQGQVVSLIGRSGIGKTQLFKILSGLLQPTTGKILLGEDLHPVKSGEVGIVHQNYILFNHRTIEANLKIGLDHCGKEMTDKEKESVIKEYAGHFDLLDHLKKYPMQLSGGQRQRVSIIQQVLTGNKFILLDEPFSGLDALMIDRVKDLLLKISTLHEHNTLIIVSHDIETTLSISDTAWIMAAQEGKEGATITEEVDLMKLGFAWNPNVKKEAAFRDLIESVKSKL